MKDNYSYRSFFLLLLMLPIFVQLVKPCKTIQYAHRMLHCLNNTSGDSTRNRLWAKRLMKRAHVDIFWDSFCLKSKRLVYVASALRHQEHRVVVEGMSSLTDKIEVICSPHHLLTGVWRRFFGCLRDALPVLCWPVVGCVPRIRRIKRLFPSSLFDPIHLAKPRTLNPGTCHA